MVSDDVTAPSPLWVIARRDWPAFGDVFWARLDVRGLVGVDVTALERARNAQEV